MPGAVQEDDTQAAESPGPGQLLGKPAAVLRVFLRICGQPLQPPPGVISNMVLEQVKKAEEAGCVQEGYIVNVDDHKTARSFMAGQLFLWPEEFQWLRDWVAMQGTAYPHPHKDNQLVFFTGGRGPAKDLNTYLRTAWAEMGLPGRPIFTDIRMAGKGLPRRPGDFRW
ncbi:hypothetical protein AALO_G00100620 [Alosa alosa]|uniref:Uncharacterized protein n=1 Tax=Alosa alosa TaxID=278164 RepID=A0AAV6GZY2_9TELE|nr:hypothetical protein AALO_G00100620 [Alosa alosa]